MKRHLIPMLGVVSMVLAISTDASAQPLPVELKIESSNEVEGSCPKVDGSDKIWANDSCCTGKDSSRTDVKRSAKSIKPAATRDDDRTKLDVSD